MAAIRAITGLALLCIFCCLICFGEEEKPKEREKSIYPDSKIIYESRLIKSPDDLMAEFDAYAAGFSDDPLDGMAKFYGAEKVKIGINDPKYKLHGEFPYRVVKLGHFMMDKYPVTITQFKRFQRAKKKFRSTAEIFGYSHVFFKHLSEPIQYPAKSDNDVFWRRVPKTTWAMPWGRKDTNEEELNQDLPAVHVSHNDASAYCMWRMKRLPTEAEWEYAARGGNKLPIIFPWGDHFQPKKMNHWQGYFPGENLAHDGHGGLAPVNAFQKQNDKDMFDLVGNAWEWTDSFYIPYDRSQFKLSDVGKTFVAKGGSFIDTIEGETNHPIRVASRWPFLRNYTAENLGFRCARDWDVDISRWPIRPRVTPPVKHIRYEDTWQFKKDEKLRQEKMAKLKNIGERKKHQNAFRKDEL